MKELEYDNFEIFPKDIFIKDCSYITERQKSILSDYISPNDVLIQIDDNYVYLIGISSSKEVFDYFGNRDCYRFDGFGELMVYLRERKKHLDSENDKYNLIYSGIK